MGQGMSDARSGARERQGDMTGIREVLSVTSPATIRDTRCILSRIMEGLSALLPAERAGVIEIALAEIINNIVEHAYDGRADGQIRLTASLAEEDQGPVLQFDIQDDGTALPGGMLPPGLPPDLSVPREALPEGGFGWLLIRTLARDLEYSRQDGVNRLTAIFDLAASDGPPPSH